MFTLVSGHIYHLSVPLKMTNSVAIPYSIFLLIVLITYTDGHRDYERRNVKKTNDERRNNEKENAERLNDDSSEDKRSNDERRNDDSSEEDKISKNERRNDDSSEEDERSNDERRNDERRNYKRRDDDSREEHKISNYKRSTSEKRNSETQNEERRTYESDDSSEEDKSSNGERPRRRTNERRNDQRRNDDSSEEERRCEERRRRQNNERRNNQRHRHRRSPSFRLSPLMKIDSDWKLNDDSSVEDEISNDERRNDERWRPFFHHSPLRKIGSDEKRNDDSSEEDRLLNFADKCAADKKEDWSYRGNNGPLMWTRKYSACGGRKQSPIDINSNKAIFHEYTEKLNFQNYQIPVETATIENNGHTIHMTPGDDVERFINFKSRTYRLKQLHFHWGNNKTHSSEHTIDTIHYALEMHLVHQSGNGRTAVVAVFFKEQRQASKELQNIIQKFPNLMYKDNSTELICRINLNNLLPANPASYYCYEGSLTTPPCTEGVQWLLLPKIMPVGTKQMAEFRKLYSSSKADSNEHCKISNNYRPLQSLNGRTVVISQ